MPPRAHEIPLPVRASIITLKSPPCNKTTTAIHKITGVSTRQIDRIYSRAISRGFEPNAELLLILDEHIIDEPRSGRPSTQTEENKQLVVSKSAGPRNLWRNCPQNPPQRGLSKDQADEEAWIDTEDEE